MPGIIGSKAGEKQASAGHLMRGAMKTASVPIKKAANPLAGMM